MDKIEIAKDQIEKLQNLQNNCVQESAIIDASVQILKLLKFAFPDTSFQDEVKEMLSKQYAPTQTRYDDMAKEHDEFAAKVKTNMERMKKQFNHF